MDKSTTLLLTSSSAGLLADIARRRPDWKIVPIGEVPPAENLGGRVWGFVDWLCPAMSGLELCRRLRDAEPTRHAHLTMVLESADEDMRRRSLQAGADDYLIGPLDITRLLERIDAGPIEPQPQRRLLVNGAVSIDPIAHQVRVHGRLVSMRPNEFRLLVHFMEHPDRVFSRAALIERLGKGDGAIDDRTVDVWVGRLRRALIAEGAPDPLRTVRSLGYVMDSRES